MVIMVLVAIGVALAVCGELTLSWWIARPARAIRSSKVDLTKKEY